MDPSGRLVSELPGELGAFLHDLYHRAVRGGVPLFSVHRSDRARHVYLWERLVLPCRSIDGTPRIVELVKPREFQSDILMAMLETSWDGILALRAKRGPDGVMEDAVVLTANPRAAQFLGTSVEHLVDGRILSLLPGLKRDGAWELCTRVVAQRATERFEMTCSLNGIDTLMRVTATPLGDGLMLSFSDVTDLRSALIEMQLRKEEIEKAKEELASEIRARRLIEGELRRIATTDGLTGVLNRRGFEERVQKATATARRHGYPLSVIAIDIDHFKRVNDRHGHAAGDIVLMAVAALFVEELRQDADVVGRVGGEEFMILLPHSPATGAATVAERLRLSLMDHPISLDDTTLYVTASFGVQELGPDGDAEIMMIEADDALYRAKHAGRNAVVVASRRGEAAPHPVQPVLGAAISASASAGSRL